MGGIKTKNHLMLFCTATCEIFIEPPPDTQWTERKEKEEYGVAMGCYLLHVTSLPLPPPPPSPYCASVAPPAAILSGLEGLGRAPPTLPPSEDHGQIMATSPKVEDGLHFGDCEYGS
jgi:hypothetical protein